MSHSGWFHSFMDISMAHNTDAAGGLKPNRLGLYMSSTEFLHPPMKQIIIIWLITLPLVSQEAVTNITLYHCPLKQVQTMWC